MIKVYKFGGAAIKTAEAVANMLNIVSENDTNLVVVVSAMGKTTNNLEELLEKYFFGQNFDDTFQKIYAYHLQIVDKLFPDEHIIYNKVSLLFENLRKILGTPPKGNYKKEYDKIISYGEKLSSLIVSEFLTFKNVPNRLTLAEDIIKTDNNYTSAGVNIQETAKRVREQITFGDTQIYVLAGFIASALDNTPTTLGREGSDYTAALIANLVDAQELVLWKDVAGIFNADPKRISSHVKLEEISYQEATELACYGAKIIHHKTTKPLIEKNIRLHVKSFCDYNEKGTIVGDFNHKIKPLVPIFIYKENQILLTISAKNLKVIDSLFFDKIFGILNKYNLKINLMQNSALNLSLCINEDKQFINNILEEINKNFNCKYNRNLTLTTVRHYTEEAIQEVVKGKQIQLSQQDRVNAFYLVKNLKKISPQ